MHEVRYHGRTIGRFPTESEAQGYRTRRLSHETEGPAFDQSALTVAPAKPFSLFCRGNLVETYDTEDDAKAARKAIAEQAEDARPRNPSNPKEDGDDFAIEKTAP